MQAQYYDTNTLRKPYGLNTRSFGYHVSEVKIAANSSKHSYIAVSQLQVITRSRRAATSLAYIAMEHC